MRKINSLKLHQMASENLSNREMKEIRGGEAVSCYCGCRYAGSGGSSTNDNCNANYRGGASGGLNSPGGNSGSGAQCDGYSY